MSTILVTLSSLLSAAHFVRFGGWGAAAACLTVAVLPFVRRPWTVWVLRFALFGFFVIACQTTVDLIAHRMAMGAPWMRAAGILGAVCALHAAAFFLKFRSSVVHRFTRDSRMGAGAPTAAFLLTAVLLTMVQLKAPRGMLLLERFVPGGGWFEGLLLSLLAAFVVEKMMDPVKQPIWRRRIWLIFTAVFFSQLVLGLLGAERFLMTGVLHPPVPAVIAAGPIYRGGGVFMLVLFGVTVLLVGPAWCSHLCYIGAFDNRMADGKRRPASLPKWAGTVRLSILVAVTAAALAFRLLGVPPFIAALVALGFGAMGILVSIFLSRRLGAMVHCTVFCPLGLFANLLGRINPFRIRIDSTCTDCGRCTPVCRYDALGPQDIARRRPAISCSLCGDCVGRCRDGALSYRFAGLRGPRVRLAFLTVVVSLYAVFLGTARI